jgi:formate dehydrogenase iron-sulfur subunit
MEFCAEESCGKCTPCRVGATRGVEVIDRITGAPSTHERALSPTLLEELCDVMTDGSLCAMGGLTPMPVRSALEHFPDDFEPAARQDDAS